MKKDNIFSDSVLMDTVAHLLGTAFIIAVGVTGITIVKNEAESLLDITLTDEQFIEITEDVLNEEWFTRTVEDALDEALNERSQENYNCNKVAGCLPD